mmetsp:Transcript_8260/g.19375  ORF Transcript_8260/g.19375 Transcript_8260/m.19375 type:complete len:213 (-) Transcript_8260:982-1620(-)
MLSRGEAEWLRLCIIAFRESAASRPACLETNARLVSLSSHGTLKPFKYFAFGLMLLVDVLSSRGGMEPFPRSRFGFFIFACPRGFELRNDPSSGTRARIRRFLSVNSVGRNSSSVTMPEFRRAVTLAWSSLSAKSGMLPSSDMISSYRSQAKGDATGSSTFRFREWQHGTTARGTPLDADVATRTSDRGPQACTDARRHDGWGISCSSLPST